MNSEIIIIRDNDLFVNHITVAKYSNSEVISIRKLIDNYKSDFEEFGKLSFEMTKTTTKAFENGRPSKIYYLNEQQATLLMTYLKNSKVVRDFKKRLVKEFFKMQKFIHNQTNPTNLNEKIVNLSESKVRDALFIAFDGKCYYTSEKLSKNHFHIDHILPKSKGGLDSLSNLVICKPKVNRVKSDSYNEEFVNHHQTIVSRDFAPRVEAIFELIDKSSFDKKYLFNVGVMGKLEDLFRREVIRELYSKLIPNLNHKKIKVIEKDTIEYFVANCVVRKEGERLITSHLYSAYLEFCKIKLTPLNFSIFKIF